MFLKKYPPVFELKPSPRKIEDLAVAKLLCGHELRSSRGKVLPQAFSKPRHLVAAAFPDREPAGGKSHRDRGRLPHDGDLKVASTSTGQRGSLKPYVFHQNRHSKDGKSSLPAGGGPDPKN